MRDAISLELHQEVTVPPELSQQLKAKKIRKMRLVAIALVNAAIKGDIAAIKEINDRMDGKSVQPFRGPGKDGSFPINFQDLPDDALDTLIEHLGRSLAGSASPSR